MDEDHFHCPQCGSDLHGIPQVRCPECGYGFDYAALRSLGKSAEWGRFAVARAIILRSALGLYVATSVLAHAEFGFGVVFLFIFGAACLAGLRAWATMEGVDRLWSPGLVCIEAFVMMAAAMLWLVCVESRLPLLVATLLIGWAWWARCFDWPAFSSPNKERSAEFGQVVRRHVRWAQITLGAAIVVIVLAALI